MKTLAYRTSGEFKVNLSQNRLNWQAAPQNQTALIEQVLNQNFALWSDMVKHLEGLFKDNVYEAEELTDVDLRTHRVCMYDLLCAGEQLALHYLAFSAQNNRMEEFLPRVTEIDVKKCDLLKTVY